MTARLILPALCVAAGLAAATAIPALAAPSGQQYLPKVPSSGSKSSGGVQSSSSGTTTPTAPTSTTAASGSGSGGKGKGKGKDKTGHEKSGDAKGTDTTAIAPTNSSDDGSGGSSGTLIIILLVIAGVIVSAAGMVMRRRQQGRGDLGGDAPAGGDEAT
jgi:cobalamin biosynthesis Mg chelatase CobN